MTKLSRITSPSSIALIGVSSDLQKNSGRLFANLINTKFEGEIYLVNPNYSEILQVPCYDSILDVSEPVDLACIISPPLTVPNIVRECIEKNVKSIVVLSDGFSMRRELSNDIQDQLSKIIKAKDIVLYGPNTEGISLYDEKWGLSCSPIYEPKKFKEGKVGLISVGDIGQSIVESNQKGIGFSYWFSPGDEIDITVEDCLEFLIEHDETEIILLAVKEVKNSERFKRLLLKAFKKSKPVIYFAIDQNLRFNTFSTMSKNKDMFIEIEQFPGLLKVDSVNEMVSIAWLFDQNKYLPPANTLVFTWSTSIASYLGYLCESYEIQLPKLSHELNNSLKRINHTKENFSNPVDLSSAIYKNLNVVVDSLKTIIESKEYTVLIIVIPFQLNYQNEVIVREMMKLNLLEEVLFVPLYLSQGNHEELASDLIKEGAIPYFTDEHLAFKSLTTYLQFNSIIHYKLSENN